MLIGDVTAMDLSGLLTAIGSIFTALIGYVADICNTVTANPILLIGFAIPFTFAVVTFVRSLFRI